MNKPIVIIGDLHGCYHTFLDLLDILPPAQIYLTGDLTDRGRNSFELIQYLKAHPEIKSVRGNHDDMPRDKHWSSYNGGSDTIKSYYRHADGWRAFELDDYTYLKRLPRMIDLGFDIKGRAAIISHSPNPIDCWDRMIHDNPAQFVICGHNPLQEAHISDSHACIDTGCVFGNKLTALIINDGLHLVDVPTNPKDIPFQSIKKELYKYEDFLP